MKKTKVQEKGITLIALVITIVVFLILAGVTIAMLTGENGILSRATETRGTSAYAQACEQARLAYMTVKTEIMTQKVSNSSYNAQNKGTELATMVLKDLTGKSTTNSEWTKCEYNSTSKAIEITYTNSSLRAGMVAENKPTQSGSILFEIGLLEQDATLSIDGENVSGGDGTGGTSKLIEDGIEIGDYVTYNSASGAGAGLQVTASDINTLVGHALDTSTFESSFFGGASISGTFNSNEITKWRVVSLEGGIVRIIGEKPTTSRVTLMGTDGFKYAEEVLDKISEIYGKGNGATGAKSIKLEDLDLNYSNLGITGATQEYTSGKFYKQILDSNGKVTGYEDTLTEATSTNPITMKQDAFSTGGPTIFNNSEKMWPMYQTVSAGSGFWLASRGVGSDSYGAEFAVFHGEYGARMSYVPAFGSSGSCGQNPYPVLPVVSLKSSVQGTPNTVEGVTTWTLDV